MLEGVLVDLVPFDESFRAKETAWLNGPMRVWWGQDGLLSEAGMQRRREFWAQQPGGQDRFIRFGIRTKDGVSIGIFALANIDAYNRTAEVGAGIGDSAYWGGGYGSDAMLLIVEYAFRWLDLRRLWLTTMGENFRAQRQVEKCGFTREGARRLLIYSSGNWMDFLWYGMLREEWPGREVMVERLGLCDKAKARGYL